MRTLKTLIHIDT